MDDTREKVGTRIRPFWGRATLIESPVDEDQLESGLIVPHHHDDDDDVRRGVIIDIDYSWDESNPQARCAIEQIRTGYVVYFRNGVRVRDVIVVEIADILAYEADS
jgi:hypothetical protein